MVIGFGLFILFRMIIFGKGEREGERERTADTPTMMKSRVCDLQKGETEKGANGERRQMTQTEARNPREKKGKDAKERQKVLFRRNWQILLLTLQRRPARIELALYNQRDKLTVKSC